MVFPSILLGLASAATLSSALDPASTGWHSKLIGVPAPGLSSFHPSNNMVYTVTESNVFAALDGASGAIQWRHEYADGEKPTKYFVCGESVILLSPARAQALQARRGFVTWSHAVKGGGNVTATCVKDGGDVVLSDGTEVVRLDAKTGKKAWSWTSEVNTSVESLKASSTSVTVILSPPSHLSLSLLTGHASSLTSLPHFTSFVLLSPTQLAFISPSKSNLQIVPLTGGKPTVVSGEAFEKFVDVGLETQGIFVAVQTSGSATVVGPKDDGSFGSLWTFGDDAPDSLMSSFIDSTGIIHIGRLSYSNVLQMGSMQILSLGETEASPTGMVTGYTFPYSIAESGPLTVFALQANPMSNYVPPTRTFIASASGLIVGRVRDAVIWTRDEGLANVGDVKPLFMDLAVIGKGEVKELLEDGFVARLERHIKALSAFVLRKSAAAASTDESAAAPHMIILASSTSRALYGLDAGSGRTLWHYVPKGAWESESWKWVSLVYDEGNIGAVGKDEAHVHKFLVDPVGGRFISVAQDANVGLQVVFASSQTQGPFTWVERRGDALVGVRSENGIEVEAWTFRAPQGATLGPIAAQDLQSIASLGRVLGDRSTLLKYLNPHLLAISTSSAIHLLDTSTGSVIYSLSHPDPVVDVSLVLRDNWLLYTHVLEGGLTGVVSVELYQREGEKVESRQLSWVVPERVKVVGVTRTKLGITSYSAIFTTATSQLVAIPRRVLDPRRPVGKPSKADQEEGLLPYEALLPVVPRNILTHAFEIRGVDKLHSSPGARESESMVLATGLDLFGTTLAPSRTFDALSEGFNKVQLLIAVTILSVALVATRTMVKAKEVKKAWYSST